MFSNIADDRLLIHCSLTPSTLRSPHDHEVYGICCKPIPKSSVNSLASGKEK